MNREVDNNRDHEEQSRKRPVGDQRSLMDPSKWSLGPVGESVSHTERLAIDAISNVRLRADVTYASGLMLCPSCSSPVPDGARFCPTCGHAVGIGQTEERRIVTVLFADLVGFTSLAEHLDPETVKRLVDGCFARVVDDITSFGGRVDKLLGDGVVALFGAPVAHEDDAERAVRTGLRIQQTVAEYASSHRLNSGQALMMRIGINTGEVLTGTVAGTDYTAMGDAVNTAARLQTLAEPGTVLVGNSTYALSAHTIGFESAGELVLRGRDQATKVWRAVHVTAPPGRRRRRRDVALVGRTTELALATSALDVAFRDKRSVVITITGDSGVGKSRLAEELIATIPRSDVAVLQGTCVPYGEANVWWPLASALTTYLDLDAGAPIEQVRATADARARRLGDHLSEADIEHLVETFALLLGYPSALDKVEPSAQRAIVHRAINQVISLRVVQRPLVLAISDLHWADQVVIDLLEQLTASLARLPFALVTTMRPGADIVWPPQSDRVTSVLLSLHPLSRADTARLAAALLDDEAPSDLLLTTLFERSGGNPLFLQELAALNDRGGALSELPDSLRTLIGARLDQLTPEQRQVLDNAATLGTSGGIGSLQRFADEMRQPFDPITVDELEDLGLLARQGRRWWFRSESVRDTAYQTLTKANRAKRHAGVAKAIANGGPGAADDIAHHTAAAAEIVRELGRVSDVPHDIVDQAIQNLHDAASRAVESGSGRVAIRHSTRALDLIDGSHASKMPLLLIRAGELIERRVYADAHSDILAVLAEAERQGDQATEGEARWRLGSLLHSEGKMDAARTELSKSVELLRKTDRPDALARALRARGFIELFGGSLVDGEPFFAEADSLYRDLHDERGMAWVQQHRAWASFLSGDVANAHDRLTHAAETLSRLGDRNGVGWAMGLLAFVEFFQGNFDQAEALAAQVAAEADERGDEWASGMMQVLLADLRLWQGRLDEAVTLAETARGRFRKLGDRFGQVQASNPLIRASIGLGRATVVQRTSEEVLAWADTAVHGPFPLMVVAGAAMHRGDADLTLTLADRAIESVQRAGGNALDPGLTRAMGLMQAGRIDEAEMQLDECGQHATGHPNYEATFALLRAVQGNGTSAIEHAERALGSAGATYLDQVIAYLAAAGGHATQGHHDQAVLTIEAAVAKAMFVGDVVTIALSAAAYERLTGTKHAASDGCAELSSGWTTVINQLFRPEQLNERQAAVAGE